MRTLLLTAAVLAAFISTGCVSTSDNNTNRDATALTSDNTKLQTLFTARLQPVAGVVASEQADGSVKVSFPGTTAFLHAGAGINEQLQQQLNAVAGLLKSTDYQSVIVLGHTDSSGRLAYNHTLSQQRAEQVKTFLVQQGLAAEQLNAEGRGPAEPIADNNSAEGRAANRRIEIVVMFNNAV